MNKSLKKFGFRKMDEMEQCIAFKAQRNALVVLLIALFVWTLYESYKVYAFHTSLNLFPCLLLVAASWIQILSQFVMTRNEVKNDQDSYDTSSLIKIIIFICIITSIAVTIGAAIIIMGIQL